MRKNPLFIVLLGHASANIGNVNLRAISPMHLAAAESRGGLLLRKVRLREPPLHRRPRSTTAPPYGPRRPAAHAPLPPPPHLHGVTLAGVPTASKAVEFIGLIAHRRMVILRRSPLRIVVGRCAGVGAATMETDPLLLQLAAPLPFCPTSPAAGTTRARRSSVPALIGRWTQAASPSGGHAPRWRRTVTSTGAGPVAAACPTGWMETAAAGGCPPSPLRPPSPPRGPAAQILLTAVFKGKISATSALDAGTIVAGGGHMLERTSCLRKPQGSHREERQRPN